MRKLILATVIVALVFGGLRTASVSAGTTRFGVVVTGDSILQLGEQLLAGPDRYIDVESGRQPYAVGLEERMSTAAAAAALVPLVAPGGILVVQDNGVNTTDADWRALLRSIVDRLPDDRCLVGVLPVFLHPTDPAVTSGAAVRANIMVAEFTRQPCHDWIRWNQKVVADPNLVYDGQHPTPAGRVWLADQVSLVTGTSTQACS
jgi:hypothetical protein